MPVRNTGVIQVRMNAELMGVLDSKRKSMTRSEYIRALIDRSDLVLKVPGEDKLIDSVEVVEPEETLKESNTHEEVEPSSKKVRYDADGNWIN